VVGAVVAVGELVEVGDTVVGAAVVGGAVVGVALEGTKVGATVTLIEGDADGEEEPELSLGAAVVPLGAEVTAPHTGFPKLQVTPAFKHSGTL